MGERLTASATATVLYVVCRCDERLLPKVRYVFDTLLMTHDIPVTYVEQAPEGEPCVFYGDASGAIASLDQCIVVAHCADAWRIVQSDAGDDGVRLRSCDGVPYMLGGDTPPAPRVQDIGFDLVANAFYFLSSWAERRAPESLGRRLYADSVFAVSAVPQDIVDRYLALLMERVQALCKRLAKPAWPAPRWPDGAEYAVVLTHDIDFIPRGMVDIAAQGAKSAMRPLVRRCDLGDAWRTARGFVRAVAQRRDPYGCIPELLEREAEGGVRASFQVAVANRHPADVNYRVEDERTRDYLRNILDSGFELCLHGSYRSTERADWYAQEVDLLTRRLVRPLGSRQHFLSFDYDVLFAAQEGSGIEYDMSMGYPDRPGARAGFSFPYFPYCLEEDRPYRVLEISLFLMDVTLSGYMALKAAQAGACVSDTLGDLRRKRGCASVVWHPIVFGGARDPGFDRVYWDLVEQVRDTGGLATDGRSVNAHWRSRAKRYASFA